MRNNKRNLSRRRCGGGRADERGSAIVLVLVSVVLMAILAATLLQVTRFERIPRPARNIDIVVESVVQEILNQATDDLLDADGYMFNPQYTATNGGGDEPWDFPWTNITGAPGDFGREFVRIDGTTVNVYGGAMDDAWLAATAPDFRTSANFASFPDGVNQGENTTIGVWRKITNLTGGFLGGVGGQRDLSSTNRADKNPYEYPLNYTNPLYRDVNLATDANALVDADGDGIGDSRWEWAPLRQIGTTRYTMAVRIVDLSARVDVNVAMGRFNNQLPNAPRGDSPTELDGHNFVAEAAMADGVIAPGTAAEEWRDLLNFRLSAIYPNPPALIAPGQPVPYDGDTQVPTDRTRRQYLEDGAALVSPRFDRYGKDGGGFDYTADAVFGLTDAFELLQHNGLNSANQTLLERLLPDTLRESGGSEDDNYLTVQPGLQVPTSHGQNWDMRDFWQRDIRKQLSPYTGSMLVARPYQADQLREPKLDVNEAVQTAQGLDELSDTISDVLLSGTGAAPLLARFPHLATEVEFANQLAANIADYIDEDNALTVVGNRAGFEALPFITEVYTQRLYEVVNIAAAQPPPAPQNDTVTWRAAGEQGLAIEIGNPFATYVGGVWRGRPVSLENVWLVIGNAQIELSTLPSVPASGLLEPGEVLIIRRNSTGNTVNAAMDDISSVDAGQYTGTMTVIDSDVTSDARFNIPAGTTGLTIELRAEEANNSGGPSAMANWAYNACQIDLARGQFDESVAVGTFTIPLPGPHQAYVQTDYQGLGKELRMMTVAPEPQRINPVGYKDEITTITSPSDNCDTATGEARLDAVTAALRDENKPANASNQFQVLSNAGRNDQQIAWPDNPRERMAWVGDILQIPVIGPDRNAAGNAATMARAFELANTGIAQSNMTALGIQALMMPYRVNADGLRPNEELATAVVDPDRAITPGARFGLYNLPHALLLLERLTTFNPAVDGEDGDDQGDSAGEGVLNPDEDELLLPGKINLNTVTQETLERVLPYPSPAVRRAYAQAIIDRRESLRQYTDHNVGTDEIPGLAYTSLLYEHINTLAPGFVTGYTGAMDLDNNSNNNLNSFPIDWNNYETTIGNPYTPPAGLQDGVVDDREEQLMLTKWLGEMAETRSDIFAAYIIVQGYPANDFTAGTVESAQLIVIFSRANVQTTGDRAQEIGRFRIK